MATEFDFQTCNPRTGQSLNSYRYLTAIEIESCLAQAYSAFQDNLYSQSQYIDKAKSVSSGQNDYFAHKAQLLLSLADAFETSKQQLAEMIHQEMGKALSSAVAEIDKSVSSLKYCAKNWSMLVGTVTETSLDHPVRLATIIKQPMGPLFTVMPWNFPVWQLVRCAIPAVLIGNPILLKHADITAGVAEMLARIFKSVSGDLLWNLRVSHEQAAQIIADSRVRAVTLTGSSRAGSDVAALAGKNLKKSVLELGGSDPYLILADADVASAAKSCAFSRMINGGQSCIAAKRFLVHESLYASFISAFRDEIQRLSQEPVVLAHKKIKDCLYSQVDELLSKPNVQKILDMSDDGLKSSHEIYQRHSSTAFFPAMVLHCSLDVMASYDGELFGPVALVATFADEASAIRCANSSPYGLGAAVFSKNKTHALLVAAQIESGMVAINDFVQSDARIPFGGVKQSGYGRELTSYGFDEFCNIKSIVSA